MTQFCLGDDMINDRESGLVEIPNLSICSYFIISSSVSCGEVILV